MQLILASQSPYRRAQLENFGVAFTAVKPEVDEEALKRSGPPELEYLTRFLSERKAESLRLKYPDALLLGSDQIAEVDGRRLDKPGTRERAIEQLEALQGRTHHLLTSLALILPDCLAWTATETTTVTMRKLSRAEIEAYVDLDKPLDCAGSYKIEKAGLSLISSIEGRDPSAIQGLPLILFCDGLRFLGVDLRSLE